jgi:hypothetical protein
MWALVSMRGFRSGVVTWTFYRLSPGGVGVSESTAPMA